MGLDPASAPSADGAISRAHGRGNLLIALFGMLMGPQNDLDTYRQRLRCAVSSDKVLKALGFFSSQFYWISGFGTSHWLSPPHSQFIFSDETVKLEKDL